MLQRRIRPGLNILTPKDSTLRTQMINFMSVQLKNTEIIYTNIDLMEDRLIVGTQYIIRDIAIPNDLFIESVSRNINLTSPHSN